jgi:hypothetical protein
LPFFIFRSCWITFLTFICSPIHFLAFLASYFCDCFSSSSVWNIPLSIFSNVGLVNMKSISLSLWYHVFNTLSILNDSLAEYSILGWWLFLTAWIILLHAFLAIKLCPKGSEVILVWLPLYISWDFDLSAFSILSFFSTLSF